MKISSLTFFVLFLSSLSVFSQKKASQLKFLGVKYDNAGEVNASRSMDSSVVITCVVEVLDTVNVKKIHVMIGNATGKNVFNSSYSVKPTEAEKKKGLPFRKDAYTFYIPTIKTTQLTDYSIQVCSEDLNGNLSPYISWKK
jgi:hypothetical protein